MNDRTEDWALSNPSGNIKLTDADGHPVPLAFSANILKIETIRPFSSSLMISDTELHDLDRKDREFRSMSSPEKSARCKALRASGMTYEQIAVECGWISESTARRWCLKDVTP